MSEPTKQPTKVLAPIDEVRGALTKLEDQFKLVLPPHISPQKYIRVAMTAIQQNADLLNADRSSLYGSALKCATDGLVPDGREAAFVIFNTNAGTKTEPKWIKKVQYLPMVSGIIKKLRNTGELYSITPGVVYAGDEFDYYIDENGPHLKHKPNISRDPGAILTHAYAIIKLKDGATFVEVMTKQEVDTVRNSSKSKDSGPWATWYNEMAKKTVIKRASKLLPSDSELRSVIESDNDFYDVSEAAPTPIAEPSTKPKKLGAALEAQSSEGPVEEVPLPDKPEEPPI